MSSSSAGYVTVFVATLEALKEETLLKVTENGPSKNYKGHLVSRNL